MKSKKPNFFLIGAPKCGTTSLANWLKQHPSIFIPEIKEPQFFADDLFNKEKLLVKNIQDYQYCYKNTTHCHQAVGDCSTGYLFSQVAVDNILEFSGSPKFIVMVRNPIEMVQSFHNFFSYSSHVSSSDFYKMWKSSPEKRISNKKIDEKKPAWYDYSGQCMFGELLTRLLSKVDRKDVHILLLEDVKENPSIEYQKILGFLGVELEFTPDFSVLNETRYSKSALLNKLLMLIRKHKPQKLVLNRGVLRKLQSMNTLSTKKSTPVSENILSELRQHFYSDVQNLSFILDRDLSHWVKS